MEKKWAHGVRVSHSNPPPFPLLQVLPPAADAVTVPNNVATRFAHSCSNRVKAVVNAVVYSPDGRRVTTGNQAGEFTLWHGTTFNFDTIMAAHQHSILGMTYTNSGEFLISCDRVGVVKYWTHQMSQQAEVQAHAEACKAVTVSPLDRKFATASDDGTVKVWDFYGRVEERVLTGHNANVTSVAWHPAKSLLASSGKDNMVKLWDASSGKELRNLPGHTSWVLTTAWNPNGWWLLSGSRDNTLRVTDIRMMRVVQTMTAGHGGVTAAAWHPYTERLLVAGMADGAMQYWSVGQDFPQAEIPHAHDSSIWDFAWQPTGGILASVSNDFATKIWARSRPGDGALQYAYQGNPTKGHPPNNNPNLVPVPAGLGVGGALVAAQAALAAGGGAGAGASAALAGGKSFAELSFEEMESEARRTVFSGAGGRVPDIRPGAAFGGGGAAASGPRPPPGSYVCKKCNVPGHWVRYGFGVAGGGGPSDAILMGGKVSREPPYIALTLHLPPSHFSRADPGLPARRRAPARAARSVVVVDAVGLPVHLGREAAAPRLRVPRLRGGQPLQERLPDRPGAATAAAAAPGQPDGARLRARARRGRGGGGRGRGDRRLHLRARRAGGRGGRCRAPARGGGGERVGALRAAGLPAVGRRRVLRAAAGGEAAAAIKT
jgi:hypothetical protein